MEQFKLGLKKNWKQFTLLVIVNALVGGMVGMERSIFPQFADLTFGIASKTAILSFITAFGITKALTNYYTGKLANKFGRRNLLLLGWLMAMPVPFLLMYAPTWSWVIFANVLLGASQGLTWSSTVLMKIDLVGEKDRGFAMGINEFAGYFSVGLVAFLTGYIANQYGLTPYPFYVGVVISVIVFLLTACWVKDTRGFVQTESKTSHSRPGNGLGLPYFFVYHRRRHYPHTTGRKYGHFSALARFGLRARGHSIGYYSRFLRLALRHLIHWYTNDPLRSGHPISYAHPN